MRIALLLALLATPLTAAAAAPEPLRATRTVVVFGDKIGLSGRFSHGMSGQPVSVAAKEYGEAAYAPVAVVTTTADGRWSAPIEPAIQTSYQATSLTQTTTAVGIRVRPRVSLAKASGRFVVLVVSTRSYERRSLFIQRRVARGWRTVARVVLSRTPRRFDVRLPRGSSRLRAFLPRSQAGAGYLAGISRVISVRR